MSLYFKILIYCLLIFLGSSESSFAVIGKKEFESIEKISRHILSNYPKEQYIYVGVGRSPVPIMAYLQSEAGTVVCNVPLTNFRYGVGSYPKLNTSEEDRLFQHFDDYLPSELERGERNKILLVDFAHVGTTIASSHYYFMRYIEPYRPALTVVDGLVICMEAVSEVMKCHYPILDIFALPGSLRTETSSDQFDHLLMMFASRMYLDKAEYTKFDIKNPTVLKKREEYLNYVNEMKEAKQKSKFGTLNDAWTNTLFEIGRDPKKEEEIEAIIEQKIKSRGDLIENVASEEKMRLTKEIISELVANKCGESVSAHSIGEI